MRLSASNAMHVLLRLAGRRLSARFRALVLSTAAASILAASALTALAASALDRANCDTGAFKLRSDFAGAGIATCTVLDAYTVELRVRPEDTGRINPSPWYGFHVRAHSQEAARADEPAKRSAQDSAAEAPPAGRNLRVVLLYGEHEHRYAPKWSVDGAIWKRVPAAAVTVSEGNMALALRPDERGYYVSAQENLNIDHYAAWQADVARQTGEAWQTIGSSVAGRPIHALHTNPDAASYILLLGRQHPPEVTGALALKAFVERLLELRRQVCRQTPRRSAPDPRCGFFERHDFVLVPLLNPDGVADGHWRHNKNGTDLNRDWGPFRQPETQAVRDLVDEQERGRKRLRAVLDFHSTRRNVFYTQDAASPTRPADFATRWLDAARAIAPLYEFEHAPRPLRENGTVKNYYYRRFGIPSITYEVADDEERGPIAASAAAFAQALVDVFVAEDEAPPAACADAFCFLLDANKASTVMLTEESLLSAQLAGSIAESTAWIAEEQAWPGAPRSGNYAHFETRLAELAGTSATNIHLGRSRQDLHGTVRRMQTRERWLQVAADLLDARRSILALAEQEARSPVPAYTHGVMAQPTTYGHYLLAFSAALGRDASRLREGYGRLNRSPLGAAALGTSGFPINRHRLATLLGFDAPIANSLDANLVASADFKLEFAAILSQSAATIGRFAQDVHTQYHNPKPWIELGEDATSGSSIMPQKRNPRPIDRLRSSASTVVGRAQTATLLAHNANTGMHDYRQLGPLLALADEATRMYRRYGNLLASLRLDQARALAALEDGHAALTEVADMLVRLGDVPFRSAHGYASALVDLCRSTGRPASSLSDEELRGVYAQTPGGALPVAPQAVRDALDPRALIANRRGFGGPQPDEMRRALAAHRQALAADADWLAGVESDLRLARQGLRDAFQSLRDGDA